MAKARALVAESGTVGIPIVMHTASSPDSKARGEYTAAVLRDLGYTVTVEEIPADAPRSVTDKYQIQAHTGWLPDYPLPGTYYDSQVGCRAPSSSHFCDPAIQALADEARSLRRTDPARSLTLWTEVDHRITDEAALVPFLNRVAVNLVNPNVGNVIIRPGFGPIFGQMWVK
jgi:ABC-type transport system substrate-binding protein